MTGSLHFVLNKVNSGKTGEGLGRACEFASGGGHGVELRALNEEGPNAPDRACVAGIAERGGAGKERSGLPRGSLG